MTSLPATGTAPESADPDAHVSLPLPDMVTPGKVLWPYAITIGLFHVIALGAFVPWLFTWTAAITMVVGVFVFGQGINLCYHRLLSHRSFVVPLWLERFFVMIALCCMQDTPGKWVAIHRYHHNHSDHQEDPHSPLVNFLWAHVGWLIIQNPGAHNVGVYRKFAGDVLKDPFYLKLEKTLLWVWIYIAHAALFTLIGAAVGWFVEGSLAGALRFGMSMLVWGVILRTVVVWHITWSVNSLTHLFGYQTYKTGENSRNNWLVGLLAVGEGWHNNHHHDPASASNQHRWYELDFTYYVIKALEVVGLAKKVTQPRHVRHAGRDASAA
ncbi:MAG: fatty acid desaturase [Planctomycetota bacterium]